MHCISAFGDGVGCLVNCAIQFVAWHRPAVLAVRFDTVWKRSNKALETL